MSEQSKLRSTHDSNFGPGAMENNLARAQEEERKVVPPPIDPELEKLYGAARGFGEMSMMSDWEKDSALSG